MSLAGSMVVFAGGGPSLVDPSSLTDPQAATIAALSTRLAAAEAAIMLLQGAVAVLQGKPDPCVALVGTLPVATLQLGTLDTSVPVPGLLRTDTVAVEVEADLPSGLALGAAHPARDRDGVLLVQLVAGVAVSIKAPIPLRVTALR